MKTIDLLINFAVVVENDFTNQGCLFVAVLSHGEKGIVYGTDSISTEETKHYVYYSEIFENFTAANCPSLKGKPKVFFFQVGRTSFSMNLCHTGFFHMVT